VFISEKYLGLVKKARFHFKWALVFAANIEAVKKYLQTLLWLTLW
jgi:hypothetical protein